MAVNYNSLKDTLFKCKDFKDMKITIIGLGLIGGSLSKALKQRLNVDNIIAIDKNIDSLHQGLADGNISEGFTKLNEHALDSDVIFICTPVKLTIGYIDRIKDRIKPECIVTDVGSTKMEIINYIDSVTNPPCFIGGHPMAGTEKTGYSSASSHLFENAYYVLTPSKNTKGKSLFFVKKLVEGIGAIPVIIDAKSHDRVTAGISHVPHIIASALVNLIKEIDCPDRRMQMLAAGGFKDITRIASSNPEIWQNIILSNKIYIENILNIYIKNLLDILESITKGQGNKIYNFFKSAKDYRNTFTGEKVGPISPSYQLTIDVIDEPGIIGKIATLLGKSNINIKNINVSHSREFEQGCLIVSFTNNKGMENAYNLLHSSGYEVFKRL